MPARVKERYLLVNPDATLSRAAEKNEVVSVTGKLEITGRSQALRITGPSTDKMPAADPREERHSTPLTATPRDWQAEFAPEHVLQHAEP